MKIEMVEAGQRPPFPLVLHAHAVLMGSFLLLLLAQTWLMATGRCAQHLRLGLLAMVLAPALVVVGFILAPTMYYQTWNALQSAPPEAQAELQRACSESRRTSCCCSCASASCFHCSWRSGCARAAATPGIHKRMMFLATVMALPAGIDRIPWLVAHHAGQPAVGRSLHPAGDRADVPVGRDPQPLDPPGLCHLAGGQHPVRDRRCTHCGTPLGGTRRRAS